MSKNAKLTFGPSDDTCSNLFGSISDRQLINFQINLQQKPFQEIQSYNSKF